MHEVTKSNNDLEDSNVISPTLFEQQKLFSLIEIPFRDFIIKKFREFTIDKLLLIIYY